MAKSILSPFLGRLFFSLLSLYSLWWFAEVDQAVVRMIKVALESFLPSLLTDLARISNSPLGGWTLRTTVSPVQNLQLFVTVTVPAVYLLRALVWIPAALALIFASAPSNPRKWGSGLLLCSVMALLLVSIPVAFHLAVLVNGMPPVAVENVISPLGFPTTATPYPLWYFRLIDFAFYLAIIVGPMLMPPVLWVLICRREIERAFENLC